MKKVVAVVVVAAAGLLATAAHAQFARPEAAVKYRQSALTLMGNHMGRINAQLKSSSPNLQAIQSSASLIETLSKLPFEAFTPDSDLVTGTKAKPAVWKEPAKFKQAAEKFQAEAAKLATVAKGGDVKAIQAQFGVVGQTCKACHDDFQEQ
jgi:cytochrome c556